MHRVLSQVRWVAGGLRTTAYVQGFLGEYTPGPIFGPATIGGAFWDGRAEGCGASTNDPNCQVGDGTFSETITPDDLPVGSPHVEFLGPVADQALNPTSRPGVEQNTREKSDCQLVKTAKYKDRYEAAWGAPIDCNQQGDPRPTTSRSSGSRWRWRRGRARLMSTRSAHPVMRASSGSQIPTTAKLMGTANFRVTT